MMSQYNYHALAHCFLAITYLSTDDNIIIMICYNNMHFITKDLAELSKMLSRRLLVLFKDQHCFWCLNFYLY